LPRVVDQVTILEWRGLLDSMLVASEVVEEMRFKKRKCIVLKIDFKKIMTQLDGSSFQY